MLYPSPLVLSTLHHDTRAYGHIQRPHLAAPVARYSARCDPAPLDGVALEELNSPAASPPTTGYILGGDRQPSAKFASGVVSSHGLLRAKVRNLVRSTRRTFRSRYEHGLDQVYGTCK